MALPLTYFLSRHVNSLVGFRIVRDITLLTVVYMHMDGLLYSHDITEYKQDILFRHSVRIFFVALCLTSLHCLYIGQLRETGSEQQ